MKEYNCYRCTPFAVMYLDVMLFVVMLIVKLCILVYRGVYILSWCVHDDIYTYKANESTDDIICVWS